MGICLRLGYIPIFYLWVFASVDPIQFSSLYSGGFAYGVRAPCTARRGIKLTIFIYQLLDVLNAHFQVVFKIDKTQSTLLQLAYFGAYLVWSPIAGIFVRCPASTSQRRYVLTKFPR